MDFTALLFLAFIISPVVIEFTGIQRLSVKFFLFGPKVISENLGRLDFQFKNNDIRETDICRFRLYDSGSFVFYHKWFMSPIKRQSSFPLKGCVKKTGEIYYLTARLPISFLYLYFGSFALVSVIGFSSQGFDKIMNQLPIYLILYLLFLIFIVTVFLVYLSGSKYKVRNALNEIIGK